MRFYTSIALVAALSLTLAGCSAAAPEAPAAVEPEVSEGPSAEEFQAAACTQAELLLEEMLAEPALSEAAGNEIRPEAVSDAFESQSQKFAEGEVAEVFPDAAVSLHDISVGMLDGAGALNADGTGTLQVALTEWAEARQHIVETCGIAEN
ncbi:hypothetical protein QBL02_02330 [Leucobacter sp. UT-8R-CII-1-4]|uniref:hypothetical protein n=1 Tax=Leucobacter sp. UT-8R-CII-1-4 TaxID=3040075 RepID=UPI0024A958A9|nr:hypothetical protein [Leucobacter sp. UT-8R-CII-1-4]MDI6022380.1 hypothetical protein [Leucobacter sp. UT-8R-CII-1-4]